MIPQAMAGTVVLGSFCGGHPCQDPAILTGSAVAPGVAQRLQRFEIVCRSASTWILSAPSLTRSSKALLLFSLDTRLRLRAWR